MSSPNLKHCPATIKHIIMTPPAIIAPSILSADFSALGAECVKMMDCEAQWLHIDIMDGESASMRCYGAHFTDPTRPLRT